MEFLKQNERIIAVYRYKMFRAAPLWFLLFCLSILYYGVGIVFLVLWFLIKLPAPTLYITNQGIIYKEIKSKRLDFSLIDRIEVRASLPQKMFGYGYLIIRTNGWIRIPWVLNGFSDPESIKKKIYDQTSPESSLDF